MIIETKNLTKRYGPELIALDNLSLQIEEGDCFGYIGPNGAGKTTTIKILATLLQPTWGEARVCGMTVGYQSRQIRPLIGYVPDFFGAYEDMVVQEYLEFFASAYNINGRQRTKIVADVLDLTDLTGRRDALVDGLSRGMKQRLSIARVLLHNPRVLLMDEPASGLDPRARIEIRELLKELKRMGKTILISSHILHELAELCTSIGIIEKGELIFQGSIGEALRRARMGSVVHVQVADQQGLAQDVLQKVRGVQAVEVRDGMLVVRLESEARDFSHIAYALLKNKLRVRMIREEEVNLETAFMRLTKGIVS
jgi:ABC-2 type transport system ATP-binding protein